MATKDEIIADIQRVAARLEKRSVTTKEFSQYGNFSSNTVRYVFGSWNEAIVEAGLDPIAPRTVPVAEKIPEDDLLREIIHLAELLGKAPTEADMNSKGKFSTKPYKVRWGSLKKA